MVQFYDNTQARLVLFNCSRQLGKSLTTLTIAIREALQNPGHHIVYAAPTAKQAKEILTDKLSTVLKSCPIDLRPRVNKVEGEITFANGSRISMYGVDADEGRRARGNTAHLVILDEAGFMRSLSFLIKNVFSPFLRQTGGRMIIASTPPHTVAHDYSDYVMQAQAQGGYLRKTITQSGLPLREIKQAIKEHSIFDANGKIKVWGSKRPTFRIEYMCEIITDQEKLVIPEWPHVADVCVANWERPAHFKPTVVADWGYTDHTGILFGYVDFEQKLLIIEDEIMVDNTPPSSIAEILDRKLTELWPNKPREEIRFIADIDRMVTSEIYKQTGISFISALKHNAEGSLNNLRTGVGRGRIRINSRCGDMLRQLEGGTWEMDRDGVRKDYRRSEQLGHLDLIDALKYFYRMADFNSNPEPIQAQLVSEQTHHVPSGHNEGIKDRDSLGSILGNKRR